MDQAFINDLFYEKVQSNHRFIIQCLLYPNYGLIEGLTSWPRPDQTAITRGVAFALCKHRFNLVNFLLSSHEGPVEVDGGFRLSQVALDELFRIATREEDDIQMTWLLQQYSFSISKEVIDDLYVFYHNHPRYEGDRGRGSPRFIEILYEGATEECREAVKRRDERRQRANAALRLLHGNYDTDIHAFSRTTVGQGQSTQMPIARGRMQEEVEEEVEEAVVEEEEDEAMEMERPVSRMPTNRPSLNSAIRHYLQQEVLQAIDVNQAIEIISQRLHVLFPQEENRLRAERLLSDGLSMEALQDLALAVTFLLARHPDKIDLWIQGFLVEAVQVNSCNPGVVERIVTGLRGLGDSRLDAIFQQVEGPALARFFLSHALNFMYSSPNASDYEMKNERARRLAEELFRRGLHSESSMEEVRSAVIVYATEQLAAYLGGQTESFRITIESVAEVVVDTFDEYVKPHLMALEALPQEVNNLH
eukprot:gene11016-12264_t